MHGICNSLVAAFAILAHTQAAPVDSEVTHAGDPNKPNDLGFTPLDQPDPIPGGGPSEYPSSVSRKFKRYVALGDSYSAGPGATTKRWPTKPGPPKPYFTECYQTDGGWPVQLRNALDSKLDFQFSACTGWDTKTIRENEVLDPASNFNGEGNKWPDLVSITMGGNNDNAFITVVKACAFGVTVFVDCDKALKNAQGTINGIDQEFTDTMNAIMDQPRDGWRTLVVMGYPVLYNQDTENVWNCKMSTAQRKGVNDLVNNVDGALQRAAAATHATYSKKPPSKGGGDVVFADPNSAFKDAKGVSDIPGERKFDGHRFCEANQTAYFNGGAAPPLTSDNFRTWLDDYYKGLFHPDANGMRIMADAAQIALSGLSAEVPVGDSADADAGDKSTKAPTSAACKAPEYEDADPKEGFGTEVHEYTGGDIESRGLSPLLESDLTLRALDTGAELTFKPDGVAAAFKFAPPDYPHYDDVGLRKGYLAPKYPGMCGVGETEINFQTTKPGGFGWASEHVFEKQCLRNYIQYMTKGILPSGRPLQAGKAKVPGIFDENGAFFKPWPGGNVAPWPSWGVAPKDSAFGLLGHAKSAAGALDEPDDGNLMVLEAATNRMKGVISKKFEFISDSKWNSLRSAPDKLEQYTSSITTGVIVMRYMQHPDVVKAYNYAYVELLKFWRTFRQHPDAERTYDYEQAFKDIVADDLKVQVDTHHGNWLTRVHQVMDLAGPSPQAGSPEFTFGSMMGPFLDKVDDIMRFDTDGMLAPGDPQGDPMNQPGLATQ